MNWLLLRGLGREKRHWHDFTPLLEKEFEVVHCIDLPGAGEHLGEITPTTIAGHTDFLRPHFFKNCELNKPWGIIGTSLGGMIALDWASRFPDDFNRLVVINSSSKDTGHILQRLTLYAYYRLIRAIVQTDPITRETEIMKMISNSKVDDTELIKYFAGIRKTSGVSKPNLLRQLVAASRFILPLEVKIPTLILASLKDNMVDVRCSKLAASHLNAPIKIHPTAGHELCLDDPDWCVKQIIDFANS